MRTPDGKPKSSHLYWPLMPKTLTGPMVPQRTDAVKKVLAPGQVKCMGDLGEQTSSIFIYVRSQVTDRSTDCRGGLPGT